mmetsp:Transcript_19270/g.57929  ORF Transcript_19270/g.57929 Transcript_19270/m.57929 type:complete len:463 (-) Transcript_19270:50-1438(-)
MQGEMKRSPVWLAELTAEQLTRVSERIIFFSSMPSPSAVKASAPREFQERSSVCSVVLAASSPTQSLALPPLRPTSARRRTSRLGWAPSTLQRGRCVFMFSGTLLRSTRRRALASATSVSSAGSVPTPAPVQPFRQSFCSMATAGSRQSCPTNLDRARSESRGLSVRSTSFTLSFGAAARRAMRSWSLMAFVAALIWDELPMMKGMSCESIGTRPASSHCFRYLFASDPLCFAEATTDSVSEWGQMCGRSIGGSTSSALFRRKPPIASLVERPAGCPPGRRLGIEEDLGSGPPPMSRACCCSESGWMEPQIGSPSCLPNLTPVSTDMGERGMVDDPKRLDPASESPSPICGSLPMDLLMDRPNSPDLPKAMFLFPATGARRAERHFQDSEPLSTSDLSSAPESALSSFSCPGAGGVPLRKPRWNFSQKSDASRLSERPFWGLPPAVCSCRLSWPSRRLSSVL